MWARLCVRRASTHASTPDLGQLLSKHAQRLVPDAAAADVAEPAEDAAYSTIGRVLAGAPPPHWPPGARAAVAAIARTALGPVAEQSQSSTVEPGQDRPQFHLASIDTRTLLAMTRVLADGVAPEMLAAELTVAAAFRTLVDWRETADRPWTAADRAAADAWQADPAADPVLEFEPRWLAVDFGEHALRLPVVCGRTVGGLALLLPGGRGDNHPATTWLIQRAVEAEEPLVYSLDDRREPVGILVEDHPGYQTPAPGLLPAEKQQLLAATIACISTNNQARIRQAPALFAAYARMPTFSLASTSVLAGLALTAPPRAEMRPTAAAASARVLAADALLACCDPPRLDRGRDRFFDDPTTVQANLRFVAGVVALARGAGPMQVLRELAV